MPYPVMGRHQCCTWKQSHLQITKEYEHAWRKQPQLSSTKYSTLLEVTMHRYILPLPPDLLHQRSSMRSWSIYWLISKSILIKHQHWAVTPGLWRMIIWLCCCFTVNLHDSPYWAIPSRIRILTVLWWAWDTIASTAASKNEVSVCETLFCKGQLRVDKVAKSWDL